MSAMRQAGSARCKDLPLLRRAVAAAGQPQGRGDAERIGKDDGNRCCRRYRRCACRCCRFCTAALNGKEYKKGRLRSQSSLPFLYLSEQPTQYFSGNVGSHFSRFDAGLGRRRFCINPFLDSLFGDFSGCMIGLFSCSLGDFGILTVFLRFRGAFITADRDVVSCLSSRRP